MFYAFLLVALARPTADPERSAVDSVQLEIHQTLRSNGYHKWLRLGQRTYYVPLKVWKPRVMVHEEGFARIRGTPVYAFPSATTSPSSASTRHAAYPGITTNPVVVSGPPPTSMGGTFVVQGRKKVWKQEERLAQELMPLLSQLQDAHWTIAQSVQDAAPVTSDETSASE